MAIDNFFVWGSGFWGFFFTPRGRMRETTEKCCFSDIETSNIPGSFQVPAR